MAVERARRPLDPAVLSALRTQNAALPPSPRRDAHLDALAAGAAAVVTGQQVGLFLGPLFTLHKAASAVRLAQLLTTETGSPVVPVFWLQTEDHDLPEVAACHLPGPEGPWSVSVPADAGRISIAHLCLPPEVETCLASLRSALGDRPHCAEHLDRLGRHYRTGAPWGRAFAGVLAELFAPEGLVIVDPRDPAFGPVSLSVHQRAFERAEPIAAALSAQAARLEAAGLRAPVHVRPRAPLSFFHPEGPEGPRYRLAPDGAHLVEVGGNGRHLYADLLRAIERDPSCVSTSALLRPILQDRLLPTAAYVGGPSEVAYFDQLGPLYEAFEMTMPLVMRRASLRLIDPNTRRALERLGVEAAAIGAPGVELLAGTPAGRSAADVEARLVEGVETALEALRAGAPDPEPPELTRAVERTRDTVRRAARRFAMRYQRAWARRDADRAAALRTAQTSLWPGGLPQERVYGLPYFGARFGDRHVVERILEVIDPLDPNPRDAIL